MEETTNKNGIGKMIKRSSPQINPKGPAGQQLPELRCKQPNSGIGISLHQLLSKPAKGTQANHDEVASKMVKDRPNQIGKALKDSLSLIFKKNTQKYVAEKKNFVIRNSVDKKSRQSNLTSSFGSGIEIAQSPKAGSNPKNMNNRESKEHTRATHRPPRPTTQKMMQTSVVHCGGQTLKINMIVNITNCNQETEQKPSRLPKGPFSRKLSEGAFNQNRDQYSLARAKGIFNSDYEDPTQEECSEYYEGSHPHQHQGSIQLVNPSRIEGGRLPRKSKVFEKERVVEEKSVYQMSGSMMINQAFHRQVVEQGRQDTGPSMSEYELMEEGEQRGSRGREMKKSQSAGLLSSGSKQQVDWYLKDSLTRLIFDRVYKHEGAELP